MERYFPVFRAFSFILFFFGLTMLLPLGVSLAHDDGAVFAYDEAIVVTVLSAIALWLITFRHKGELMPRDAFLLVVLIWGMLPAFACLPLLIWYWPQLSVTDAYFEAVSGLTATGATVLVNLDALPASINLWRGQMVWMGGMGLVVLAVAVLPMLGIGGRQMFKAETPGPMKETRMTPRIAQTAKGLWLVYFLLSGLCVLAYAWAGMGWFDAVMHTFTTMGLGGFSNHDASFGYFNSPLIEAVCIAFMLIAALNFATHFLALSGRSFRPYARDPEALWLVAILAGSIVLIAGYLIDQKTYSTFAEAFRYAAFNVVSVATTTGFANTDYNLWPIFAPLWMIFLGSFVSSAGSTGGGIKMMRALLLYKQVYRELVRAIHPSAIYPVKVAGDAVPNAILFAVLAFSFAYMCIIVALTLVMAATGLDIVTSFSAVAASINNIGPGLNLVGPATTFAVLTDFQTWVCALAMLLGRLEIFSLLVVLTPAFWRR
jgi:trk system potassium uptake protein